MGSFGTSRSPYDNNEMCSWKIQVASGKTRRRVSEALPAAVAAASWVGGITTGGNLVAAAASSVGGNSEGWYKSVSIIRCHRTSATNSAGPRLCTS
ncbi:hypothetical protein NP493_1111g00049 [Ridgeia piscesae]|uniref:CUB domain-containing protein n=1 Tax=Ridgeia piscesae TaxID=27915 RepID=A0AAD9NJY4_RIDPI|nr:hypothetical protein NP493_1111g00049 [Ridgeia piscesae]